MKRLFAKVIAALLILLTIPAAAGCPRDPEPESESLSVAYVVRCTANNPDPSFVFDSAGFFDDDLYNAAYTYGSVSLTVVDEQPRTVVAETITPPTAHIDGAKKRQRASRKKTELIARIKEADVASVSGEADTLAAISRAAKLLGASSSPHRKLVIVDSGLSTAGEIMNFAQYDLFETETSDLVDLLAENNALPSVQGCQIVWRGISETAGTQTPLPASKAAKLENIWSAILSAGGAESVTFLPLGLSAEAREGLPPCSNVLILSDDIDLPVTPEDLFKNSDIYRFTQDTVCFIADTDRFVDPAQAREWLSPVAQYLGLSKSRHLVIAGSIASVGSIESSGLELSLHRAVTCSETILELCPEVSPEQIVCLGLGRRRHSLRTPDINKDGVLVEEAARLNRVVYITPAGSCIAEEFLSIGVAA